jgi:hypothetical protein
MTTMTTMCGRWREPATMTMRQDADVGNAVRGRDSRHQAIEDDDTGRLDPAKYLIYRAN